MVLFRTAVLTTAVQILWGKMKFGKISWNVSAKIQTAEDSIRFDPREDWRWSVWVEHVVRNARVGLALTEQSQETPTDAEESSFGTIKIV